MVRATASGFGGEIYDFIGDVSSRELLKNALLNEPDNITVKNMLVADYLEELYFGAHHLPDTLITEVETGLGIIKESAEFISKNREFINVELIEDHKYYSQLYSDYNEWFTGNHTYDFTTWCEKNKRNYSWVKAYYYK